MSLARIAPYLVSCDLAPPLHSLDMIAVDILLSELEDREIAEPMACAALVAFLTDYGMDPPATDLAELRVDAAKFGQIARLRRRHGLPAGWLDHVQVGDPVLEALQIAETALQILMESRGATTRVHLNDPGIAERILKYRDRIDALPKSRLIRPSVPRVISISLDVAGSTAAKRRMFDNTQNNPTARMKLYEAFMAEFLRHETLFYENLMRVNPPQQPHLGAAVTFERMFVVKGIGDEQWLLVMPPTDSPVDMQGTAVRVIESALVATSRQLHANINPMALTPEDQADAGADPSTLELPLKVFVDVIGGDALEIGRLRYDHLARWMAATVPGKPSSPVDPEIVAQLNAGFVERGIGRLSVSTRTDYIGHEIDRLFRTAASAAPGIVTVGDNLYKELTAPRHAEQSTASIDVITIEDPPSARRPGMRATHPMNHILEARSGMKGIDGTYDVHHLFYSHVIRSLCSPALTPSLQKVRDDLLANTYRVLKLGGVLLRPPHPLPLPSPM